MNRSKFLLYPLGFLVLSAGIAWAGQTTLTTYYPSPTGNYKNLTAQNITVTQPGSAMSTIIGDAGCGASYDGLSVQGALSGCTNYSLLGDGSNLYINRPSGGNIWFRENNNTGMTIATGGNVGINNASPGNKLSIVGGGGDTVDLNVNGRIQSGDGSGAGGMWVDNSRSKFVGADGSNIGFFNTSWGLTMDSSGNVQTNGKLGVSGYSAASGYPTGWGGGIHTWDGYAEGSWGSGSGGSLLSYMSQSNIWASGNITAASDERLKQNILPLTGTLSKLDQLRGVSFEWNHLATSLGHKEGEKDIGMIAQELQKVYPQLVVASKNKPKYLSIDYGKFTAVLLQSVKELKSQMNAMQDQINALQRKVKTLERQK